MRPKNTSPVSSLTVLTLGCSYIATYVTQQSKSVKIQQPTVQGEVQQETVIEAVKGANKSFQKNKQGMPQTKTLSRPRGAKCVDDVHTAEHCVQQKMQNVANAANWQCVRLSSDTALSRVRSVSICIFLTGDYLSGSMSKPILIHKQKAKIYGKCVLHYTKTYVFMSIRCI